MSIVVAQRQYLLPSALGDVVVTTELTVQYDVEDIIRNRAISQGRALQFIVLGQQIDSNAATSSDAIGSSFANNQEQL